MFLFYPPRTQDRYLVIIKYPMDVGDRHKVKGLIQGLGLNILKLSPTCPPHPQPTRTVQLPSTLEALTCGPSSPRFTSIDVRVFKKKIFHR